MNAAQYKNLTENFNDYKDYEVSFKYFIPSANRYSRSTGFICGFRRDEIIISSCSRKFAIHYTNVCLD